MNSSASRPKTMIFQKDVAVRRVSASKNSDWCQPE